MRCERKHCKRQGGGVHPRTTRLRSTRTHRFGELLTLARARPLLLLRCSAMSAHEWATGELDRVVGATVMAWPRRAASGGEADTLRALPRRVRRKLTGAGYLSGPRGEPADVVADLIIDRVPGVETTCAAVEWYIAMSLAAHAEQRRLYRRALGADAAVLGRA